MRTARLPALAVLAALSVSLVLLAGCQVPDPNARPTTQPGSGSTTSRPPLTPDINDDETTPEPEDCPGHWHATFAIYLPTETPGTLQRLDFAGPKGPDGRPYYNLGVAPRMSVAIHMHQDGHEAGTDELKDTQWHYESDGRCVTTQFALWSVEVEATNDTLNIVGAHSQSNQTGTWRASETPIRAWVRDEAGQWSERPFPDVLGYQMRHEESLLIAVGTYSDTVLGGMQASVPRPSD